MNLTDDQIERYSRHILLSDVGGKGQEKIMAAKVLVIGAGGLGAQSPPSHPGVVGVDFVDPIALGAELDDAHHAAARRRLELDGPQRGVGAIVDRRGRVVGNPELRHHIAHPLRIGVNGGCGASSVMQDRPCSS